MLLLGIFLQCLFCVLAQEGQVLSITETKVLSSSSVRISWQINSDSNVERLEARLVRSEGEEQKGACNDSEHTSKLRLTTTSVSYTFEGLRAYSTYNIWLTAYLDVLPIHDTTSFTTHQAAPSASPQSVMVMNVTSSEATVQWKGVSCIERNGNVTAFVIRYAIVEATEQLAPELEVVGGSVEHGGEFTLTELYSATNYSMQVAARNTLEEVGPYSEPIVVEMLSCVCPAETSRATLIAALTVATFTGTTLIYVSAATAIVAAVWWKWRKRKCCKEETKEEEPSSKIRRWCVSSEHSTQAMLAVSRDPPVPDRPSSITETYENCVEDEEEYYANEEDVRSMTSRFSQHFHNS